MSDIKRLIRDTTAAPLGEIIASVGQGVAEAQKALDSQALAQLEALFRDNDDATALLRQSGWRPTFYTLPDTEGEVKVSLSVSGQGQETRQASSPALLARKARIGLYASPVDAGYQNRFGYQATVGATLKFRIVPVPPPTEIDALAIRAVPDLRGSALEAAGALLDEFQLILAIDEQGTQDGEVLAQQPPPGKLARRGDTVTITLGPGVADD